MGRRVCAVFALSFVLSCATSRPVPQQGTVPPSTQPTPLRAETKEHLPQAVAPKEWPRVPPPSASAAWVPEGFRAELVVQDLVYPTSVELDDGGNLYVAEAGYSYGDLVAPARVFRIGRGGEIVLLTDALEGPVNDLLWHQGTLYVSHRGKVSTIGGDGAVRDLVTKLPASGDHQNNQLAMGPDGLLYVGMGTVTNSGVVGLDNVFPYLWLTFYPDLHDLSPFPLKLKGHTWTTPDPLTVLARQGELVHFSASAKRLLSNEEPLLVQTGAFQPFGHTADRVPATQKANGTILRMRPDGSSLEVYAWGLRNPFGVAFGPDGTLWATENGYDERGSRPIANAPDNVWRIRQGGWYGFPDFAGGEPVTDAKFRPTRGAELAFLLAEHPPVEQPAVRLPPHVGVAKLDVGPGGAFGAKGALFVAEVGGGQPVTGKPEHPTGYQVLRLDPASGKSEPFFHARADALGPRDQEYVTTAGPKRPVDVRFAPDGGALYVADFGAITGFPAGAGPALHPFPGTGAVWRIVPAQAPAQSPPQGLSPLPRRASDQPRRQ